MAFYRGPNVVTNGLVLSLDAGNTKSYTSGSTTWYDKSGYNNSGSLVNGPTFSSANGGSITFVSSSTQYVSIPTSTPLNFSTNNQISINVWFNTSNSLADQFIIFRNSTGATGFILETSTTSIVMQIGNGTTLYTVTDSGTNYLNQWVNVCYTLDGTSSALYKNGSLRTPGSFTGTIYNSNANIALGFGSPSYRGLSGSISNVQVYNRALSAAEVTQNYNALKSRFNLT